MSKIGSKLPNVVLLLTAIFVCQSFALTPNPIISKNKTVYGSPSSNVDILVNGKFGGETWAVSNGSWVAINVGGDYSKVLINWNNTNGAWSDSIAISQSCKSYAGLPVDYDILTSSNSTDGTDGDWTTALSITNNIVTARSHAIDFNGAQWIKMSITNGGGYLDEVEVFDISNGSDDTWFFPGTSITAVTYKSTPPAQSFADLVTVSHPTFTPAIVRGGIGCINSTGMMGDISKYLDAAGNCKYWGIEMGTNDAWGGSNYYASTFKANMQQLIDSCKARNIQPILARVIGTDSATTGWQVHPDFLAAVDSLTVKNNLIPGPDLYTYFSTHTSELSDGVHPNATGGASLCRLWAEKMDSLYSAATSINNRHIASSHQTLKTLYARTTNRTTVIQTLYAGTLSVYSLKGTLLDKAVLPAHGTYALDKSKGFCIVRFSSVAGNDHVAVSNCF